MASMPSPTGSPESFLPLGCPADMFLPKARKTKETKTKETKPKLKAKRPTKKEQDEQAVHKLLASPALEGYLKARISDEVEKQMKSAKLDHVYEKAYKVMKQFALLGDGDPDKYAEEQDCLVQYMGKMVKLQIKRKTQLAEAAKKV